MGLFGEDQPSCVASAGARRLRHVSSVHNAQEEWQKAPGPSCAARLHFLSVCPCPKADRPCTRTRQSRTGWQTGSIRLVLLSQILRRARASVRVVAPLPAGRGELGFGQLAGDRRSGTRFPNTEPQNFEGVQGICLAGLRDSKLYGSAICGSVLVGLSLGSRKTVNVVAALVPFSESSGIWRDTAAAWPHFACRSNPPRLDAPALL